jgi:ABC-type lipoprotein export system ATPase subunit
MALLSLERVSKSHWRGRHEIVVLEDVSLELEPGELVAIFGQRAAGKTTLLRIAAGVAPPDGGIVRFDGRDLAALRRPPRLAGLHPSIGWVRRGGPLIASMDMLDHVALPLLGAYHHRDAHRRAAAALRQVGARDLARATWRELSDAERALVMVAQAIVRTPALLLADDPTVALGVEERETVLDLLRATVDATGMAVAMTAPDLPDMLRADRVLSLSDGELIEGTRPASAEVIDFPLGRGESA